MLILFAVDTAPKVLNNQTLASMGQVTVGGAALTPVFNMLGQVIKQHPKVKNDWLRWMLPLIALFMGIGILYAYIRQGYSADPLTEVLFVLMFPLGAWGADGLYNALKNTSILPAGPDNHPADASKTITIQTPTTTGVVSNIPPSQIVPTPPTPSSLPPSPFAPKGNP